MDWKDMLQTTMRGTRGMASPMARRVPVPMAMTWGSLAMNHVMITGAPNHPPRAHRTMRAVAVLKVKRNAPRTRSKFLAP